VSAFNVRGRSPVVLLDAYTVQPAEKQTGALKKKEQKKTDEKGTKMVQRDVA